jgi:hypothetical protein
MPPFLQLHALAATRGDGLRLELRILFERLAEAPAAASNLNLPGCHLADLIDFSPRAMSHRAAQSEALIERRAAKFGGQLGDDKSLSSTT